MGASTDDTDKILIFHGATVANRIILDAAGPDQPRASGQALRRHGGERRVSLAPPGLRLAQQPV